MKIPVFEHVTPGRVVSYVCSTFQMNLLLLSEKQMDACLVYTYVDDESSRFIQNVGTHPSVYMVSHSKKMVLIFYIVHFIVPSDILLRSEDFTLRTCQLCRHVFADEFSSSIFVKEVS
jgi:hypothetical protein